MECAFGESFKSCVARALFKMGGENMCDSSMVMILD